MDTAGILESQLKACCFVELNCSHSR